MTDVNLNQADCIKTVDRIGETTYHNICNGTATTLEWGAGQWLEVAFVVGIVGLLAIIGLMLIAMTIDIIRRR